VTPAPVVHVNVAAERAAVVAAAKSWLRTPFHHGGRIKGVGVDCVQLLMATYEEAGVASVAPLAPYAIDWFLHENDERYLDGLNAYTAALAPKTPLADGDIALFKYGRSVSHAGILVDVTAHAPPFMVHAFRSIGVTLDQLTPTDSMTARCVGYRRPIRWMA